MTLIDFSIHDPQPTNAYYFVEAVLSTRSGNKPVVITDCTLMFSENDEMKDHYSYWVWDFQEALLTTRPSRSAL